MYTLPALDYQPQIFGPNGKINNTMKIGVKNIHAGAYNGTRKKSSFDNILIRNLYKGAFNDYVDQKEVVDGPKNLFMSKFSFKNVRGRRW